MSNWPEVTWVTDGKSGLNPGIWVLEAMLHSLLFVQSLSFIAHLTLPGGHADISNTTSLNAD